MMDMQPGLWYCEYCKYGPFGSLDLLCHWCNQPRPRSSYSKPTTQGAKSSQAGEAVPYQSTDRRQVSGSPTSAWFCDNCNEACDAWELQCDRCGQQRDQHPLQEDQAVTLNQAMKAFPHQSRDRKQVSGLPASSVGHGIAATKTQPPTSAISAKLPFSEEQTSDYAETKIQRREQHIHRPDHSDTQNTEVERFNNVWNHIYPGVRPPHASKIRM